MKKLLLCITALFTAGVSAIAQPYGEGLYPYPGQFHLSTGIRTSLNSPGHLMAGYEMSTAPGGFNFVINKSGPNGGFGTGSNPIRRCYQMVNDSSCTMSPLTPINNCEGVTAIETFIPGTTPQWYAISGAWDEGCFFATLSATGGASNLKQYLFPFPQSGNGKTLLIESTVTPNTYYICGKWDESFYVLHVDQTGSVLWQQMYTLGPASITIPNAMIESPLTNELIIVGGVTGSMVGGIDGFFLKMSTASGAINLFKAYGRAGKQAQTCQYFNDIKEIGTWPNNQYVICGFDDPSIALNTPWVIKLDNAGNILWTKVIAPSTGNVISQIPALDVRLNPNSLQYEYYVATYDATLGMVVLKIDDNGMPFPTGFNQFEFNANPTDPSWPTDIDVKTSGPSIALTTYGTADGVSGGPLYLTRSCFNGVDGCNNTTYICCDYAGPNIIIQPPLIPSFSLTPCQDFDLWEFDFPITPQSICSYSGIPPGGSNAREAAETGEEQQETAVTALPNPTSSSSQITYMVAQNNSHVTVCLYNYAGQLVKTLVSNELAAGEYRQEIDFAGLGLESGMYVVAVTTDGKTSSTRIIYNK